MGAFRIFLLIIFCSFSIVYGQTKIDVIYLVNGDIYKEKIIDDIPGDYVHIKIRDGSIKKCLYSEIQKREISDLNQFNIPQPKIKHITLGLKSGLSNTTFTGDDATGSEYKSGFLFGGFINFPVKNHASVQPELIYAQHGAKHTDSIGEVSINTEFLALPVIILIEFPLNDISNLYFYPGFGLGRNISTIKIQKVEGIEQSIDYTRFMTSTIVFLTAGLSFDSKISEYIKLIFDLRANTSFTSLLKQSDYLKDLSYYFMLGFGF